MALLLPSANRSKLRILAHDGQIVRRFLSITLGAAGDGSLYVTLDRQGISEHATTWQTGAPEPQREENRKKGFRLSYHPTGRLHSYDLTAQAIFLEPLFNITQLNTLIDISIPSADRLDPYEDSVGDQHVIALPNHTRINFRLCVAPNGVADASPGTIAIVSWRGLFDFVLAATGVLPPQLIPPGHDHHFLFFQSTKGTYEKQVAPQDEAFVRFHQRITGTANDLVIYGPNGAGEYLMVFCVPMRTSPTPLLSPVEPDLYLEVTACTNHFLRYKIRRKLTKEIVKVPIEVQGGLNARM